MLSGTVMISVDHARMTEALRHSANSFEGALWRNIPLRERLAASRRRRYLRSLLHRLRIALLLPGDGSGSL